MLIRQDPRYLAPFLVKGVVGGEGGGAVDVFKILKPGFESRINKIISVFKVGRDAKLFEIRVVPRAVDGGRIIRVRLFRRDRIRGGVCRLGRR